MKEDKLFDTGSKAKCVLKLPLLSAVQSPTIQAGLNAATSLLQ